MKRFPQWTIIALAALLLVLLTGGIWYYSVQEQHLRQETENELTAIAQLKVNQIADWRQERLDDAELLMNDPFFTAGAVQSLADPSGDSAEQILAYLSRLKDYYEYEDVMLVDPDGQVRLRQGEDPHVLGDDLLPALAAAFRDRRPVLVDLYVAEGRSTPRIGVIAPLFEGAGQTGTPVGAVVQVSDPTQFLYPLIQAWPTQSDTAETLLVRREQNGVLFLNDLRHQPDAAMKLRIPLSQTDLPAVAAVQGVEGVVEGKDYRGVDVIAVVQPIPDSPWYMVTKVDSNEAFSGWRFLSVLFLTLLLSMVALAGVGGLLLWERGKKTHYRALYESEAAHRATEERYGITLNSIGDAVITTDAQGRVELLNPVAEALTGWTSDEARGKPVAEVLRIINEETRGSVANPVTRVLAEGRVVGMANHTILIAKDGTKRPIADSGAPIRDELGAIGGVVLVFRDQTEERAAQQSLRESEARFSTAFRASPVGTAIVRLADRHFIDANTAYLRMFGYTREEVIGRTSLELNLWADLAARDQWVDTLTRYGRVNGMELEFRRKSGEIGYGLGLAEIVELNGERCLLSLVHDITDRKNAENEKKKLQRQLTQAQKMEAVGRLAGGVAHDFNNMLSIITIRAEMALRQIEDGHPLRASLQEIRSAADRSAALIRQLLAFARKQPTAPTMLDLNDTVASMLTMLQRLIGEDIDLGWRPGANLGSVKIDPVQVDQILANLVVNARDAVGGVGKITIETENSIFDEIYCAQHVGFLPGAYVMLAVSDDGHGIDPEIMDHLFEPFYTTKGVGEGTGLGLATVYGIVEQNQGFINVYSEPGKGASFRIYLPRHDAEITPAEPVPAQTALRGHGEKVLLVEDEPALLDATRMILEQIGYVVCAASSPRMALNLAEEFNSQIDLLLTDVVMPEMNGRELAQHITTLNPGLKCLYMSGYTANVLVHRDVISLGSQVVQKPFSINSLAAKVRAVLDHA